MIHEVVDIERWKAMFPLEPLRAEARAMALQWRARNPEQWLENKISSEAMAWWSEHQTAPYLSQRDKAEAAIRAERSHDPDSWDRRQLDRELASAGPAAGSVTSPYHLAVVDHLRDELLALIPPGRRVPTDVFLWGRGEALRREITKLGGLPYWPADRPWPTSSSGEPLIFVAQVCFADSRDIVADLPGDVLLIFAHPIWERLWDGRHQGDESLMQFAWMPLGETELVDSVAPVKSNWAGAPYWGTIHRTYDYPDLDGDNDDLWDRIAPDLGERYRWSGLDRVTATKIGGIPWWEQGDPGLLGRFLCVLEAIGPAKDRPYPYVNVPEPIGSRDRDPLWDAVFGQAQPTGEESFEEEMVRLEQLYPLYVGEMDFLGEGRFYLQFDGQQVHWEYQSS